LRLKFSPRDVPKVLWRYSRVWGWSSVPEMYRRFFWGIKVEVVSQGQIFLEERPVVPGNSIWTQLFCSISWFECCIKTRLANYSSHVCKFESSQREGQSFDLFWNGNLSVVWLSDFKSPHTELRSSAMS